MQKTCARYLIFCLIVFLGSSKLSFSQQGNIWYFGNHAGLNFNTNPPTALTDGQLSTSEGCASISDKNGNILFYTDGTRVYNRVHQVMPNGDGLMGGPSSTNSAIVIPKPGSAYIYYIFTAQPINPTLVTSYAYSEVDMQLDGSLGDVTTKKNIFLYSPATERLTAVKHANGKDYWVITKGFGNNSFSVYKIDCDGVNSAPVVSNTGAIPTTLYDATGAIKVSPDGKKVCIAINGSHLAQLFDFDNTTGKLSNAIDLTGYDINGIYGVEFSPNSKLLYVSTNRPKVNQYDITSNNAVIINASKYVLTTKPGESNEAIQLGPDKKLYVAVVDSTRLNVINDPDVYGIGCNLVLGGADLNGRKSYLGLPAYISSFFDANNRIDFTHIFADCKVQFDGTTDLASNLIWYWNFGDGIIATGQDVTHVYAQSGIYPVTLKGVPIGACAITDTFYAVHAIDIHLNAVTVFAGKDTTAIYDVPFSLQATGSPAGAAYSWTPTTGLSDPFIANPVAVLKDDIVYTVKVTDDNGCSATDDIAIKLYGIDDVFVPNSFTPNADGLNDILKPLGFGLKKIEYFKVFNRYGQLVFETTALGKGWDGTLNSKAQPNGAYTYIVKVVTYKNRTVEYAGTVILIR